MPSNELQIVVDLLYEIRANLEKNDRWKDIIHDLDEVIDLLEKEIGRSNSYNATPDSRRSYNERRLNDVLSQALKIINIIFNIMQ